jgi:hypothetical protein
MLRACGILLRQYVWVKKAGASSRTPQNRGEARYGVRRLAAAFAGASGSSKRRLGEKSAERKIRQGRFLYRG